MSTNLYFIYGDSFLVKEELERIDTQGADTFYGADEVDQALAAVNTFSLLGDARVVLLRDLDFSGDEGEAVVAMLLNALTKGIPAANKFIIVANSIDKRRKIVKELTGFFEEQGKVINHSVPTGDFKADKDAQNEILAARAAAFTQKTSKRIDMGALVTIAETIGFDLFAIDAALNQLAAYVGEAPKITADDVKALLTRTKTDPIFELTNAVGKLDLAGSLFYIDSLMGNSKMHALQILSAIANQMRKLVAHKSFLVSEHGKTWKPGMNYAAFQKTVVTQIALYDAELDQVQGGAEFAIIGKGKSAYPAYLAMQNAANYRNFTGIFKLLFEAESALKFSPTNPKLLLEKLVMDIFETAKS